eukprot:Awhi_evm2s11562
MKKFNLYAITIAFFATLSLQVQSAQADEKCLAYFNQVGRSVCLKSGYQNQRSGQTVCQGKCTPAACCRTPIDYTCKDFFFNKGKNICKTHNYRKQRAPATACKTQCTIVECCRDPTPAKTTCADYFDINGKQICDKNEYEN